jgi:hypothetical protein
MYYDCLRQALQENRKIIIDPNCGVPELWMNFFGIKEDKDIIEKQGNLDELIELSRKEPEREYNSTDDFILEIKRQVEKGKTLSDLTKELDFEEIKNQGLDVTKILKSIREMVIENQ